MTSTCFEEEEAMMRILQTCFDKEEATRIEASNACSEEEETLSWRYDKHVSKKKTL